jgi:hypothetical protein
MVTTKERDSDNRKLSRDDDDDEMLIDDGPEDFELDEDEPSPNDRRRDPLRRP